MQRLAGRVKPHQVSDLVLDGRVKPAAQSAIDHQRLDHVARHVRAAQTAGNRRTPGAAPILGGARVDHNEVADVRAPIASHDQPRSGLKERLGDQELAAAFEHGDARRGAGRLRGRAHCCSAATVRSATVSASSGAV